MPALGTCPVHLVCDRCGAGRPVYRERNTLAYYQGGRVDRLWRVDDRGATEWVCDRCRSEARQ
jgi:hypothetical protein